MAQLCSHVHGNSLVNILAIRQQNTRFPRQTLLSAKSHHMFTLGIFQCALHLNIYKTVNEDINKWTTVLEKSWIIAFFFQFKTLLFSRAFVLVWLTHPSWSVRFHSTLAVGISGDPSYKTTEAPTASEDTSQFHIIQPVCGETQRGEQAITPSCHRHG